MCFFSCRIFTSPINRQRYFVTMTDYNNNFHRIFLGSYLSALLARSRRENDLARIIHSSHPLDGAESGLNTYATLLEDEDRNPNQQLIIRDYFP